MTEDDGTFALGLDISNIGTKVRYIDSGPEYFIPTNLKIGIAKTYNIDRLSQVNLTFDINKLLVPTLQRDAKGNTIVGSTDNISEVQGIFQSFTDAPGGAKEELQELNFSGGFEYWYNGQFALRLGYYYEDPTKGGRQFGSVGVGYKKNNIDADFSFLATGTGNDPLSNVVKISVGYSFGAGVIKK